MLSTIRILIWIARLLAVCSMSMLVLFAIGGFNPPLKMTLQEATLFLFFPVGICAGMLLAWRWELYGGTLTVLCLLMFYGLHVLFGHSFPNGPWFLIFAFPGFLFLGIGLFARRQSVAK